MKFLLIFSIIVLGISFSGVPLTIQAATDSLPTSGTGKTNYVTTPIQFDNSNLIAKNTKLGNADPITVASYTVNFLLTLLGTFAMTLIVYAGYLYAISRGNEETITKAKGILTGTVIGMLLIFASYSITAYVFKSISNASPYYYKG